MRLSYRFPQNMTIDTAIRRLRADFKLKKDFSWSGKRCFYDTFDWRLYNKSLILYSEQNTMHLKSISSQLIQDSIALKKIPKFTADLPSGVFRDKLSSILEMRALIKLICLPVNHIKYRILDKKDKTNLYLVIENNKLKHGQKSYFNFTICTLFPIKGYEKYVKHMANWLQAHGFVEVNQNILEKILQYHPRYPTDYSSKINIKLSPDMTASIAVKTILAHLFNTMKINQQGIIKDIDSEFLHDYRVAIRRIRSAFGQLKDVFSEDIYVKAKKDFCYLGRLTNRMRDLDVYLLKEEEFQRMLPVEIQGYIKPFFQKTKKARSVEHNKVTNLLTSDDYNNMMHYWEIFFDNSLSKQQEGLKSQKEVLILAKKIIRKRYMKVIKLVSSITESSPDILLHKLRIECKKLRYLLEFFSSLFVQNEINYLVKQLKKLQDNLGEYNDLRIQQDTLHEYIKKESNSKTLLAVGVLIGKLHDRQSRVRNSFASSSKSFASQEIKNKFYHMFGTPTGVGS